MKAVILAAGMGSRLAPYDDLPKCITFLANGKTILDLQLENLSRCLPLSDVMVVVGYKKDVIQTLYPSLKFKENKNYQKENTAKSLLCAIQELDEDVLWINGDVVFHPTILERFLNVDESSMVVNHAQVSEEQVKYILNDQGYISKISKKVEKGIGEAIGINLFKKKDLPLLKEGLIKASDEDYFEVGVEWAIAKGVLVKPFMILETECVEVDFLEDLRVANNYLTEWNTAH